MGADYLASSHISGVIINILTKFFLKHKIHSILYMIFKIKKFKNWKVMGILTVSVKNIQIFAAVNSGANLRTKDQYFSLILF